ncbi:GNAT family N-acetyltransferase [Planococcus lenghuensis]
MTELKRIDQLDMATVEKLVGESEAEGYRFLRRLVDEYESGKNTFKASGEVLYGVWNEEGQLIAVGGLNRDRFSDDDRTGRLRRFYVSENARRQGIGSQLLNAIVKHARSSFDVLVLRTDSESADGFYFANGFTREAAKPEVTHRLVMKEQS